MNVRSARQSFPGYVLALADGLRAGLEGVGAQVVSRPEPESRPSLTTFMDYEVFLVSRIREQYVHSDEPRPTIRHGIAAIGQVVIAAATIMAVVFLSFMLGDDRIIKEFGFGLGLAILIDAFLVRLVLVPAVMHLLDGRAWYIPRWLDRTLPRVTIEAPTSGRGSARGAAPGRAAEAFEEPGS